MRREFGTAIAPFREYSACNRSARSDGERGRPLAEAVIAHLERQRTRIAFDLHDGPAQAISAARLQLELVRTLRDDSSRETAANTLDDLLDRALEDIREMTMQLRPCSMEASDLGARLRAHVDRFGSRTDMRIDLETYGDCPGLSSSAQIALFRIMQETLNNADRHGRARHAVIRIHYSPDVVSCRITDDGRGFEETILHGVHDPMGDHLGIEAMRERVALLGGTFRLTSNVEDGTTVDVRIPVWR